MNTNALPDALSGDLFYAHTAEILILVGIAIWMVAAFIIGVIRERRNKKPS